MYDLQRMEMTQARSNLAQCAFGIKRDRDVREVARTFDNIGEGCRAEFDSNVKEIRLGFLIEVPDNVGMVVRLLEDTDFTGGQGDKIPEETFDGDSAAL